MKTRTIYEAFDGTIFNSKKECQEYEDKKLETADMIAYDSEYHKLSYTPESKEKFFDEAAFIHLRTPEAVKLFKEQSEKQDLPVVGIDGCGFYVWNYMLPFNNNSDNFWYDVESIIDIIEETETFYRKLERLFAKDGE